MPLTDSLYAQLETISVLIQQGLFISGFGLISYLMAQKIAPLLGFEPPRPQTFKRPFDIAFELVAHPVGPKVGALDRSRKTTQLLLHGAIGLVVVVSVVALEFVSLVAVTGVAYAGYHFAGITVELVPIYHAIVGTLVLITLAFMTYTNQRVKQLATYA